MAMDVFAIIGIGMIAAVLAVVLRQYRPEFAILISLAAGIIILLRVADDIVPIIEQVQVIIAKTALPGEYVQILFKALGICFLTQIACDTCKDAGESAIAAKIEIAGKVAVLVVSLPLFSQVLNVVYSLIG